MVSKELMEFSKEILFLNQSPIIGQSESILLDCKYIFDKFGSENLKKVIKMFLFCVGIKRYDFKKTLFLKIDFQTLNVETVEYIANLIRFTGRKNQVKFIINVNEPLKDEEKLLLKKLESYHDLSFCVNFKELHNGIDCYPIDLVMLEIEDLPFQDSLREYTSDLNMLINLDDENWIKNRNVLKYSLSKSNNVKVTKSLSKYAVLFGILPMENFRKELLELINSNI